MSRHFTKPPRMLCANGNGNFEGHYWGMLSAADTPIEYKWLPAKPYVSRGKLELIMSMTYDTATSSSDLNLYH